MQGDVAWTVATRDDVFKPTGTSDLLVTFSAAAITRPKCILDLGCGTGYVGITLAKQGRCAGPLFASDISFEATALAKENAHAAHVDNIVRQGSIFEPWTDERFEVIVSDVAGISDEIAALSSWYPAGVPCDAGRDGTRWAVQVIEQAGAHLVKDGVLIFPVLSLSNERKILDALERAFSCHVVLGKREWKLPDTIAKRVDVLNALLADGAIRCEQKFGMWIWTTCIYLATNGRYSP